MTSRPADPLLSLTAFAGADRPERELLLRNIDILLPSTGQSFPGRTGPTQEALLVIAGGLTFLDAPSVLLGPGTLVNAAALALALPGRSTRAVAPARIGFLARSQYRTLYNGSARFRRLADLSVSRDLSAPTPSGSHPRHRSPVR